MEKNIFTPFVGIQYLTFGETRLDINQKLKGYSCKVFKQNEFAENTSDFYPELFFLIEYDSSDKCMSLNFTEKGNLYFEGENIFDIPYDELKKKYDALSSNKYEEPDFGVTYYDLGFGMNQNFETGKAEGIIIFSKNYWEI